MLETNTANMFVADSDGLNRFKSGFFVDNFNTIKAQEEQLKINNSIDAKNKQLRPRHYTNAVDLMFGPVTNVDPTADLAFSTIEGLNVRRANDDSLFATSDGFVKFARKGRNRKIVNNIEKRFEIFDDLPKDK